MDDARKPLKGGICLVFGIGYTIPASLRLTQ